MFLGWCLSSSSVSSLLVLDAHDWLSVQSSDSGVFVVGSVEEGSQVLQVVEVFLSDFGQGDAGGGLLVDQCAESGLVLNEAVWDAHLSAQGWDVHHQFNWDDIVSHYDELGLLVFDEGGDVVQAELDGQWLLGFLLLFSFSLVGSLLLESLSLVLLGLWSVLSEELEELGSLVLLQSVGELVDLSWD